MAKRSLTEALKNIEAGRFEPLYYLVGKEKYFHDRFIERISTGAFPDKGSRSLNLNILYGSENTQAELMAAVEGFPMLADRKLIIVRNFEQMKISDIPTFSKYLRHPQQTTVLVLSAAESGRSKLFSELREIAQTIECKPISGYKVSDWVVEQCKQKGYAIEPQAVQFLIDHVGGQLLNLEQEIDKIINFKNDAAKITPADLEQTTGISREANAFALQKALARRKLAASLKIVNYLLDSGFDITGMNAVLFAFFRRILILNSLRRKGIKRAEIMKQMNLRDFQIRDLEQALNHFNSDKLKTIIRLLHQMDVKSKTTTINARQELEMLCYKICRI